jgi:hypothetical protein
MRSGASANRAASSCRGAKRGEPLEDITKVVFIQVGWRLQQPRQPFGIGWADQLQRDAKLLIPQPIQDLGGCAGPLVGG